MPQDFVEVKWQTGLGNKIKMHMSWQWLMYILLSSQTFIHYFATYTGCPVGFVCVCVHACVKKWGEGRVGLTNSSDVGQHQSCKAAGEEESGASRASGMSGEEHNGSQAVANATPWFVQECTLELDAEYRRICLFLLYLFVFVVGLLENAVVLWVNWRRRHSASGVVFCVLNVSLSDMMVMGVLPFFMMEVTVERVWLWGRFLCKLTSLVYGVNFYSSSLFLAAMTLERYLSLSQASAPVLFSAAAGRRRWVLCGGIWLFSLFLALLENVHVDLLEWDQPGCYMLPEGNYAEWFVSVAFLCLIFQFLGPASVIVTCNVLIARAVRAAPEVRGRRDIWLVHVYSLVFLACWLPYHLVMVLMIISDLAPELFSCNVVELVYFSFSLVQSLSLFHCVANPILYNFLSKGFRDNLVNAVLSRLPQVGPRPNGEGGEAAADKGREVSTSQSQVAS